MASEKKKLLLHILLFLNFKQCASITYQTNFQKDLHPISPLLRASQAVRSSYKHLDNLKQTLLTPALLPPGLTFQEALVGQASNNHHLFA